MEETGHALLPTPNVLIKLYMKSHFKVYKNTDQSTLQIIDQVGWTR